MKAMLQFLLAWIPAFAGMTAVAEWQPTQPVRIVLPFAPGGQSDLALRTLAPSLSRALGQPVVLENRPGAGGNIAAEAVARSAPDGHTLLIGTNGPFSISPLLNKALPYDPVRDFAPVTLLGTSPNLIAVHPSLGVATLEELVHKARAEPGKLNYGSVGVGSVSHLTMELLNRAAGIRIVHIPYGGSSPAVAALLAGDVQVLSVNPTALIPQIAAGKARVLAQTSARRSPLIADVPTVAESGYPGFEADLWMAVMAPARTPPEAIARLNAELVKIIRSPGLKESLWDRQWVDPVGSTPEEVTATIRRESEKWSRIVKSATIGLE